MGITYDTGALIAADRAERRIWARHRALLALREVPTVPAPAQTTSPAAVSSSSSAGE